MFCALFHDRCFFIAFGMCFILHRIWYVLFVELVEFMVNGKKQMAKGYDTMGEGAMRWEK